MGPEEIKTLLEDHEKRIKKIEGLISKEEKILSSSSKGISINEFITAKKPSDDVQRTLAFAYFLEKYENKESFNADELQNCFVRSKSTKPANIHDKINKCIKKGWISEHPQKKNDKKSFSLTDTGIHIVENNFQEEKR